MLGDTPLTRRVSRRRLLTAAAAATGAFALGGLAQSRVTHAKPAIAPGGQATKRLVYSGISGLVATQAQRDIEAYTKLHPDVEITLNIADDQIKYKDTFPQIAASSDKPDIAWYWVDGRWYPTMVEAGILEPLDDVYERYGLDKVYPESTLQKYTSPDGHRYAVNQTVVWYTFSYYNKGIFQQAGIQPPEDPNQPYPKDLATWYEWCDRIRAAGFEPVTFGGKEGWILGHLHDMLLQRGMTPDRLADLLTNWRKGAEPKVRYTDDDFLAVTKLMREWHDKKVMAEGYLGRSYPEGRALFVQGKAAMYQDGSWAASEAILPKELPPDFQWGWLMYPPTTPGIDAKILSYAGNGLMLPAGGKNVELAKDFLAFSVSKERMEANISIGSIPGRTDVSPEAMQHLGPVTVSQWEMTKNLGTALGWDDPVPPALANLSFELWSGLMAGTVTPEEVGQQLEAKAEELRQGIA